MGIGRVRQTKKKQQKPCSVNLGGVDLDLEHWKLARWRYTCSTFAEKGCVVISK